MELSKINIACYCRVSTNREDQSNSFEAQQRFFLEYVTQKPEWELFEIYADEGISGTGTKKRVRFNAMIQDAYDGKFQMILTKEVSRFSRNILDTISYTRELRYIGVGVMFLTDRINTMEPESEMLLSFLASLAQEESRRTSSRVVWGQTRQMERGIVFGRSMLGYDVRNGRMYIEPEGAELVRLIFHKYAVEQMGTTRISRFLTNEGYRTYTGSTKWTPGAVAKILKNEKYAGDLIQKKSYTPDYLTHEKKKNTGQVQLIRIPDHHEPIITREIWDLAQERLKMNNRHANTGWSNRYPFSGKIKCGECGSHFVGRIRYRKDGTAVRRWCCAKVVKYGAASCKTGWLLRDDVAEQIVESSMKRLEFERECLISNVTALVMSENGCDAYGVEKFKFELERVQQKKVAVMDSYFSGEISKEDMIRMVGFYESRVRTINASLGEAERWKDERNEREHSIKKELEAILEGKIKSEIFIKTLVESITVYADRCVELKFCHLPDIFRYSV